MKYRIAAYISILFLVSISVAAHSAITVVDVKGKAAYKTAAQWRPLAMNQSIAEGTVISTGVNSSVVLKVNESMVTVRQMSMMKVNRNQLTESNSNTNIGLKYGSINARVNKLKRLRTVFKVSTPVATSSVRGTEEEVSFGPQSGMIVNVIQGLVEAAGENSPGKFIREGLKFQLKSDGSRPLFLLSDRQGNSLVKVHADSLTESEKQLFDSFGFDNVFSTDRFVTPLDSLNAKASLRLIWD